MEALSVYIVRIHPLNEYIGSFKVDAGADALPIQGTVIAAPPGSPGGHGDEILFQYNATLDDEARLDDNVYYIPPDLVYKVGGKMLNDWVFFEQEWYTFDNAREGRVVASNHKLYKPGVRIVCARGLSHRLIPEMFSTSDLYAVKSAYVVCYIVS